MFQFIYTILIFFEKPFWCYNSIFYKNSVNECDKSIAVLHIYYNPIIYRTIELIVLLYFTILIYLRYKFRISSSKSNIRTIISIVLFSCSTIDIIISLILNSFPFANFFLRPFTFIIISRIVREEWMKILKVFYKTKHILLLFLIFIFSFGVYGFILFGKSNDLTPSQIEKNNFKSLTLSIKSMFMILSGGNFHSNLLTQYSFGRRFSFIYFISYYAIVCLLIIGLLKSQYFFNYVEINNIKVESFSFFNLNSNNEDDTTLKSKIIKAFTNKKIKGIIRNVDFNKDDINKIYEYLIKFDLEIGKIFLISIEDKVNLETLYKLNKDKYSKEFNVINNKFLSAFVSLTSILITFFINNDDLYFILNSIQFVFCIFYIYEFHLYIMIYGLKEFCIRHKVQILFRLSSFIFCILFIINLIMYNLNSNIKLLTTIMKVLNIFLSTRIFFFLQLFTEFNLIFDIMRNVKSLFYALLYTQFSFFLFFSTFTMIYIGGKVKFNQYDDNPKVQNFYYYINFNDFGSSFLSCFNLMVKFDTEIIKVFSEMSSDITIIYFILFYFIGINIILNICQTYILSTYLKFKK